jgi:hypothetical protein
MVCIDIVQHFIFSSILNYYLVVFQGLVSSWLLMQQVWLLVTWQQGTECTCRLVAPTMLVVTCRSISNILLKENAALSAQAHLSCLFLYLHYYHHLFLTCSHTNTHVG